MSITLPPELAQLLAECGGTFPEADEDRLHELAAGWRRTGRTLERLRREGSDTARSVAATHHGATIDVFDGRWARIDAHFALGSVATEQAAAAVDAMALATIETKSAIISVLAAGHAQRQEMQSQVAVAFWGPLIRFLLQLLKNHIGPLLARLGQLIRSGLAALFRGIKKAFQAIVDFAESLFEGASTPEPAPLPPPTPPVYRRDQPLPHARELIENGTQWTGTGRGGGKVPLTAEPNQVYYRTDPQTGVTTSYSVYDEQGYIIKRVDLAGRPHGEVPTPHVLHYQLNVDTRTGTTRVGPSKEQPVRAATPWEIP
ncbi:polymorphic toxin type 24 domain-containing protein [Saccharopolyspora sp. NPDC002578]